MKSKIRLGEDEKINQSSNNIFKTALSFDLYHLPQKFRKSVTKTNISSLRINQKIA